MLYCVGVYHPRPGKYAMPDDYVLTADELRCMPLNRLPVTVEHAGIRDGVAALLAAKRALTPLAIGESLEALGRDCAAPVGVVITHREGADGRFYALFAIDTAAFPAVPMLIRTGALRGISLTHCLPKPPIAVELSLCVRPARSECYVMRSATDLMEQYDYMRRLITQPAMETPAVDAKTPLELAMTQLSGEDKQLVTARFADLMAACDKMSLALTSEKAARAKADTALEAAKGSGNSKMLEAQIKMMASQLNPDICATYYCSADTLMSELSSDHPATVLRAADRMICACNRQMMELRAGKLPTTPAEPRGQKRRAEPDPDTGRTETVGVEADPVARALAANFEYTL